jgi:hypothetical protein
MEKQELTIAFSSESPPGTWIAGWAPVRCPRKRVKTKRLEAPFRFNLTISTFDFLTKDPTIGRAEALRRVMLVYLGDTSDDNNANPAYWGPFSVIGEGAAK